MNGDHMTRPARRRGAPPAGERLTRDDVIAAATELIERGGTFSLRSLAAALNVRPAALYNHVTGLDDLLDAVTARFVESLDVDADAGEPWPDWVRATATRLHERMRAHPELTRLVLSRAPATPAGPALMRGFTARLESAGVSPAVAHVAWHAALTVVIGSVQQEHARNRDQTDTFDAVLAVVLAGLAAATPDERNRALLANHVSSVDGQRAADAAGRDRA